METVGLGGKKAPPGVALKPGQKGYGEDYPGSPADTLNQGYQQQQRVPGMMII